MTERANIGNFSANESFLNSPGDEDCDVDGEMDNQEIDLSSRSVPSFSPRPLVRKRNLSQNGGSSMMSEILELYKVQMLEDRGRREEQRAQRVMQKEEERKEREDRREEEKRRLEIESKRQDNLMQMMMVLLTKNANNEQ